jgi:uncharacterized membrane protein YraQ (UPF0718 family)/copper chaperone CopZ
MIALLLEVARETWLVAAQMSPWLLLGFLVAGTLSTVIAPAWLERHLGGRGMGPVFKAAALGVPLPLCSCGVIPVAASLRSHGASRGATTAFLLSTPQTGVDSILITYTMLGPVFAIFRPVVALLTGLIGGGLVEAFVPEEARPVAPKPAPAPASMVFQMAVPAPAAPPARVSFGARLRELLTYGLVTLPADLWRALLIGVVLAGVISALVPADFVARYVGPGPLSVLLMMIIGIPLYVCATASVPLAAGFIFMGLSPGAALAFLIAGPGTNAATLTTIARVLGRRALGIFLLTIAASAFGAGLLLDALMPWLGRAMPSLAPPAHCHGDVSLWSHLAAVALVLVMANAVWRTRRAGRAKAAAAKRAAGRTVTFAVEGMHCSHCVESVTRAVGELPGVDACVVDLQGGSATVSGGAVDAAAVVAAIDALGFRSRRVD